MPDRKKMKISTNWNDTPKSSYPLPLMLLLKDKSVILYFKEQNWIPKSVSLSFGLSFFLLLNHGHLSPLLWLRGTISHQFFFIQMSPCKPIHFWNFILSTTVYEQWNLMEFTVYSNLMYHFNTLSTVSREISTEILTPLYYKTFLQVSTPKQSLHSLALWFKRLLY